MLYFSHRQAIDDAFRLHCLAENLQYCILNFLAWVTDPNNQMGNEILRRMYQMMHERKELKHKDKPMTHNGISALYREMVEYTLLIPVATNQGFLDIQTFKFWDSRIYNFARAYEGNSEQTVRKEIIKSIAEV